ncbi:MAG TPA: hypothetical protein VFU81_21330 [Thermomicrobiales bacterium]|nr:hypothetical protein [Thermomicrobiales bacterium]
MLTLTRLMIAIGAVAASVGFTLLGMATSYIRPDETEVRNWIILMVVGLILLVVGMIMRRGQEPNRVSQ